MFCLLRQPDLYSDYEKLNQNGDETIKTEDGIFYFALGRELYSQGFRSFDNVTFYAYLEDKPAVKKEFDSRGGYRTVEEMKSLVDPDNVDAYYDKVAKMNTLMALHDKGFDVLSNLSKFAHMTNQEVYDYYDYLLNAVALKTAHDLEIETLSIDDAFIQSCNEGTEQGFYYGKSCPILNYLTLGLPLGDLYMIGGHSGVGKSSFVFENMILPLTVDGIKCAVISNEQQSKDFKRLLLVHILTQELNYWGLTRKKLKLGHFNEEQLEMLDKAKMVWKEKYATLKFTKVFDSDMGKVRKIVRKLSKQGYQAFFYDTLKADSIQNEAMWQTLLVQSRQLFQLASKENVSIICSFQLALHSLNKRYLDATCLSGAKQVKEVFSEMVYCRPLWDDERPGGDHDVKCYRLKKGEDGKFINVRELVDLDPDKKYILCFLDKTRNDEDKQCLVYEFNGRFNRWKEIGYAQVYNDHQ